MDERLLYLSDPEIESVRFIGGIPTPVISFEVRMRFSPHHGRRPSHLRIATPAMLERLALSCAGTVRCLPPPDPR